MDPNSYRNEDDTDQPDSYWRRRVIALVIGLGLLGVLAWAFSGGGTPAAPAPRTTQASGVLPAAAYRGVVSAGGVGPASPGAIAGHSSPSASPSPSPAVSVRASRSAAGRPTSHASAQASTPAASVASAGSGTQPGTCSPQAVVLSLFTSRTDYYGGQNPDFEIYAVSTAAGTCTFDTSPEKLHVVVMSSGRVIWDSADCAHGQTSQVATLRRGVPAQESVGWNRTISLPGCITLVSAAPPGTYQVQARTGTAASPVRIFKLAH